MEVVYNSLIDDDTRKAVASGTSSHDDRDDDIIDDNYIEIDNDEVIRLLLEYPNFINSTFIKTRLKNMISIK
jgi:hypothetical protein